MCSATQWGFRVCLLKHDVVETVGCMSATGPGKPYCSTPEGSTGARDLGDTAERCDEGSVSLGRREGRVAVPAGGATLRSLAEKSAVTAAAPVAAEMPAITAKVVFDMVCGSSRVGEHGRSWRK